MADLSSTAGTAALIAGAIAIVALLLAPALAVGLQRLRRDQLAVIGATLAGG